MKLTAKINLVLGIAFAIALLSGGIYFYLLVFVFYPLPDGQAGAALFSFIVFLGILSAALFIIINVTLRRLVLVPLSRLTRLANEASNGNLRDAEIKVSGNDELAEMSAAFNRMRRKIIKFVQLLRKHQVEIKSRP